MRIRSIIMPLLIVLLSGLTFIYFLQKKTSSQSLCLSTIIKSDQLSEINNHIDSKATLVILDIDNTISAPHCEIGTDQWFNYLWQQKQKEGLSTTEILNTVLPLYCVVLNRIPVYLIEETFPQLLQKLRGKSIPVIALTARSDFLKERTIEQLTEAGVKLPFTELVDYEIKVKLKVPAQFSHGIIFCGQNDKGTVLFYMLDQAGYHPHKIIFVDDKYSNLASVESACIKRKIPFVGIRYSRLDKRVKQFDAVRAEQELKEVMGYDLDEGIKRAQEELGIVY